MSLIYCPNCKHKISSKSKKCHYCGYKINDDPFQKMMKFQFSSVFYSAVLIVILALLLTKAYILIIIMIIILLAMALAYRNINKKQRSKWDLRRSTKIPSKSNRVSLPVEESYYYKGKTNQQLHHYYEALKCYSKSLEFNPDFEPAKKAKREVEKIILNRNWIVSKNLN